jgi:diguanylate cyclase (GGDEF)-like protein
VDHFKRINDQHGHRAGDAVLRRLAQVVRSRLRASDVFSRVGGEEFSVLLPATDAVGAQRVAEDIRRAVAAVPVDIQDGPVLHITVSAGVATSPAAGGLSADQLYTRADQALYRAKAMGRDRVEAHRDEMLL